MEQRLAKKFFHEDIFTSAAIAITRCRRAIIQQVYLFSSALSYQGISDQVAEAYMERYGSATWAGLDQRVRQDARCPKLKSYWHFHGCRYDKGSRPRLTNPRRKPHRQSPPHRAAKRRLSTNASQHPQLSHALSMIA